MIRNQNMRHARGRAGSAITLEEARARAADTDKKLSNFMSLVKDQRHKTDVSKVQRGWQQHAGELAAERNQVERDLAQAYHVAGLSCGVPFAAIQRERTVVAQAIAEEREELFQRVLVLRAKVKHNQAKVSTEHLQLEIDSAKKELLTRLKDLDVAHSKLVVDMADGNGKGDPEADGFSAIERLVQEAVLALGTTQDEEDKTVIEVFRGSIDATIEAAGMKVRAVDGEGENDGETPALSPPDQQRLDTIIESMGAVTCAEALQRLRVEFPTVAQPSLREAFMARQRKRFAAQKKKLIVKDCRQKVERICECMAEVFMARREATAMLLEREREDRRDQAKAEALKDQLEVARTERRIRDTVKEKLEAEQREKEQRELEAVRARRYKEFQDRVLALEEHKRKEALLQQQLAEEEEARLMLEAERDELQRGVNAARVKVREEELQRRRDRKSLNKLLKEAELEDQRDRLERLVQLAREDLGVESVERDPSRILQDTANSNVSKEQKFVSLQEAAGRGQAIQGYTTEKVIKDPRFRMQEALAQAGLLTTAYARNLLSTGPPLTRRNHASVNNPMGR